MGDVAYARRLANLETYYSKYCDQLTDTFTGDIIMAPNKKEYTKKAEDYPPITLDSILEFGKHKGQQVEDLLDDDPSYLQWILENEVRILDEEVIKKLNDKGYGI